ncbi:MAG: rhodanese-like domain-containing protein [Defluviitaleaceae bacterium]|nr:rhodanese-like domain-containing protein [Defluviitaleaceae bacterium]
MLAQEIDFSEVGFTQITFDEAMSMAKNEEKVIILDVRTAEEFERGHLKDAILLPYDEIMQHAQVVLPHKEELILIYCQAGVRSVYAAHTLVALGYTNIYEFGGPAVW